MMKVGTIQALWRYPVKGMAGESLDTCHIDENGLHGDRLFAVRDVVRKEIQSCKFRPGLLDCIARSCTPQARFDAKAWEIHFPDGSTLPYDADSINDKISYTLGHESTLEPLRDDLDFYKRYKADNHTWFEELKATFTREPGEAMPEFKLTREFTDYVTQPGSFFLVSPFHIITTASMAYLKQLNPEADWDLRRFRPNLVIDTVDGLDGLAEQDWINKTLHIGDTQINITDTAVRCGATTRKQQGISFDKSMLRTIVKEAEQNLGVYGNINGNAVLNVGNDVYLSE